jgi:group I intron endonuclease
MPYVYLVRCTVNGKCYVGKTVRSIESRWYHHVWDATNRGTAFPLHNAIRKYGPESFEIEKLAVASTLEELNQLEILWILSLRSHDRQLGYNASFGGDGGGIPTEETRKKLRDRKPPMLGRRLSSESKQRMSQAKRGWVPSIKTRKTWSKLRKGKPWTEARRNAQNQRKQHAEVVCS